MKRPRLIASPLQSAAAFFVIGADGDESMVVLPNNYVRTDKLGGVGGKVVQVGDNAN